MNQIWIDFCRQANIGQDSIPYAHEDWFSWLDYAVKHYQAPVTLATGTDWTDR